MAPPCPPPELMLELVEEILLRLPADDPECLVHASIICKPWHRLLSAASFRRRYRVFHRTPPLLGFLHQHHTIGVGYAPCFVPTITPTPFPQAGVGWLHRLVHSRLPPWSHPLNMPISSLNLVVWDPASGKQRQRLPNPAVHFGAYNAVVVCAAGSCDHLNCCGGPFLVVLVGCSNGVMQPHLYSSEAGAWNASADLGPGLYISYRKASVLIGDDVYFVIIPRYRIRKYNLGKNCLSTIYPPEVHDVNGGIALMPMEDGSLGIAGILCSKLYLWSRNVDPGVISGWVQFRVIELEHKKLIPFKYSSTINVAGSTEGFGIIFVTTAAGAFTIELKSGQVWKVGKPWECFSVFPYLSFCTPDCATTISLAEAD